MEPVTKPYVQLAVDAVDTVLHDPEGRYDADQFDRYATFEEAREAALCCIEATLDAGDHDDEEHAAELRTMLDLLEAAPTFEHLAARPEYRGLLGRLAPAHAVAA